MARNPGTEAEAAALRTGSALTPSPVATTAADPSSSVTPGPAPGGSQTPAAGPPALAKTDHAADPLSTPLPEPMPAVKSGRGPTYATTPASGRSPVVKTGITNSQALAGRSPAPPAKNGPAAEEFEEPATLSTRAPASPVSMGLHAPAKTPGPVVQQFVTLGRYQLLSRLAIGGMAEVYLARQGELSGFKTLVVVKKVLPHLAMKPDFIAMFLDEARIASMLDHPNVVRITEVGRTETEYFLAMELVQGKPLAAILQQSEKARTPLPHNLAALIVANAAAGLHHAHQLTDASGALLGLVHRDVSPQNIMVSFEGSVKVIDFGIARALGRLGDTNSGSLKGKLGYMAPEQGRGEPVDARADIFSLGVVLWECVAGRRLFLRENDLATLRAVITEPIPSASRFAEVDPALDAIVRRSVARNVKERFQTAEEMRVALERWVFSSGGASTHDLAALMKSWFPSDHLQWQRAARLALDMQESDPPIDVAFPGLAASRTGHSRTGASRLVGIGSGPKVRTDSFSRAFGPPSSPISGVDMVDLRPKPLRRFAIPAAVALAILAGVALILSLSLRNPPAVSTPETETSVPVRPMVETLPTVAGTKVRGVTRNDKGSDTSAGHGGEAARSEERALGGSSQGTGLGKKKNRSSSAEKRAILHEQRRVEGGSSYRPNSLAKKSNAKKMKAPRPNPF